MCGDLAQISIVELLLNGWMFHDHGIVVRIGLRGGKSLERKVAQLYHTYACALPKSALHVSHECMLL